MADYCTNGKEIFSSRGDAMKALRSLTSRRHTDGSVYQCDVCKGWHITSRSFARSKATRNFWKKLNENKI